MARYGWTIQFGAGFGWVCQSCGDSHVKDGHPIPGDPLDGPPQGDDLACEICGRPWQSAIRIWSVQHGSPVRVTVPIGPDGVTIRDFHPTDEGWHSGATVYTWDGRMLRVDSYSKDKDCDGIGWAEWHGECDTTAAGWDFADPNHLNPAVRFPGFRQTGASQRDCAAEAAGY